MIVVAKAGIIVALGSRMGSGWGGALLHDVVIFFAVKGAAVA